MEHKNRKFRKILLVLTGGLMMDGITSWAIQIYSAMNKSDLLLDIVVWPDTDQQLINKVSDLGFSVKILPNRKKHIISYAFNLLKLIRQNKYDVVHVCGSSGLMAIELLIAKFNKISTRICHSHNTTCEHPYIDKLLRPIMLSTANVYLACGTDAGRWLYGNRKFIIIPNGKNIPEYQFNKALRGKVRLTLGLSDNEIAIVHIGRFNYQKNHDKLLDIFTELRRRSNRYILFLIGNGEFVERIKHRTEKLGLSKSIHFLGVRNDVPLLLNAMDCMVLPSLYEGFPNVVVEAQINGLPCVLSGNITQECQLTSLVEFCPIDESSCFWANQIEDTLNNKNRYTDKNILSKQIKNSGFDIVDCAEKLSALYHKTLI